MAVGRAPVASGARALSKSHSKIPMIEKTNFRESESGDLNTPIPPDLLLRMHDVGVQLESEDNILLHNWGLHLLQDWRSLELLAERYR